MCGPLGPASRQGPVTQHQDSVQSWDQWAGQPPGLSSSRGTSLGEQGREWGKVTCFCPGIPQSSSKHPLTHCPIGPSSTPSRGLENRVRVSLPWGFRLQALDLCKNTHPPGDNPETFIFLLDPSHWDLGHPSLPRTPSSLGLHT